MTSSWRTLPQKFSSFVARKPAIVMHFPRSMRPTAARSIPFACALRGNHLRPRIALRKPFCSASSGLSTFRGDSALSTWLYRLTVNVVLMRLRSNHNRPLSVELAPTGDNTGEVSYLNLLPVEDLHLSGAIDRIALGRALRLPHGYRTIFLLHDVEGMAHSEIARKLGCTIGNSKSQLHQARLRLRRFLRRSTLTRHPRQAATAAIRRRSSKNLRQNEIPQSIANEIPWIPAPEIPTESTSAHLMGKTLCSS